MQIEVRDGKRRIRFDGEVLASVASPRTNPRPMTLTLYAVTDSDQYVFSRTKYSRVFHAIDCPVASRNRNPLGSEVINAPAYNEHFLNTDPQMHYVPCSDCHPESSTDLTTHRFEIPRYESQVFSDAHQLSVWLEPSPRDAYYPNYQPYTASLIDAAVEEDPRLDGYFAIRLDSAPSLRVVGGSRG